MNILILGGQGFIGYNLTLRLLKEKKYNLTIFERTIRQDRFNSSCKYVTGEFSNIDSYAHIFKNVDVVFHLISTTIPKSSNDNIEFDIESNVIATTKLLKLCVENRVKKVVFASSAGTIYGLPEAIPITEGHPQNPICSYGISKLAIEKYLFMFHKLYGLDYQILRVSNPYGQYQNPYSQQGAIGVFLGKVLRNEPIEIWGDGSVSRDYIFIDDLVEAMQLTINNDISEKILNIGSGKGTSLNQILEIIKEVVGKKINVLYKEGRGIDVPYNILDITRAGKCLNWYPKVELYDGIGKTWDWIR